MWTGASLRVENGTVQDSSPSKGMLTRLVCDELSFRKLTVHDKRTKQRSAFAAPAAFDVSSEANQKMQSTL